MKRLLAACALSVLACVALLSARPQERVTLATPAFVDAGAQEFAIASVLFDWQGARIIVALVPSTSGVLPPGSLGPPNSKTISVTYSGDVATALMVALNKANLTVKSLNTRILERLRDDGKLPSVGTVSGAPR